MTSVGMMPITSSFLHDSVVVFNSVCYDFIPIPFDDIFLLKACFVAVTRLTKALKYVVKE